MVQVLRAQRQREGAGFEVARAFPNMSLAMVDPFLLLDQMGPSDLGPREAKGAPDHPHRGFETVTLMLEGKLEHRDSHGNHGVLGPGDVQWMTAGAGVVHSEMPEPAFFEAGGRMHGVQLWVNLPAKDKMMAPRYQDIPAARIPEVRSDGATVRIVSGRHGGQEAVIDTRIPIQYLHLRLDPGAVVNAEIPAGHNGFVYVLLGSARVVDGDAPRAAGRGATPDPTAGGMVDVPAEHIALVEPGPVCIEGGASGVQALVLSGQPIGEPVARYGPFVMNTRDEIVQAVRDFQEGRFGTIAATMEHGKRKAYLPASAAGDGRGPGSAKARTRQVMYTQCLQSLHDGHRGRIVPR